MKIFTGNIDKIKDDLTNSTYKLVTSMNVNTIIDSLNTTNFLNIALSEVDKERNSEIKNLINELNNLFLNMALIKVYQYEKRNLKNLRDNYVLAVTIVQSLLKRLKIDSQFDYSVINDKKYSEEEMYKIIMKYYQDSDNLKSADVFNRLILNEQIYSLDLPEGYVGNTNVSKSLNENYVFISNKHNFTTMTTLVHEVEHIRDEEKIKDTAKLNRFKFCNNFLEVNPYLEEKKFLNYLKDDALFKDEVICQNKINYYTLICELHRLKDLLKYENYSETLSENSNFEETINLVFGNLVSDILLDCPEKITDYKFYMNEKRELLFDQDLLRTFGYTPFGASNVVVRNYQKSLKK